MLDSAQAFIVGLFDYWWAIVFGGLAPLLLDVPKLLPDEWEERVNRWLPRARKVRLAMITGGVGLIAAAFLAFHDERMQHQETKEALTKAMAKQGDSTMAAQRAWIAHRKAKLSAELKVGMSLDVTVSYDNPGGEPAINFFYAVDAFTASLERATADEGKLRTYEEMCLNKTQPFPGHESGPDVYPRSGLTPGRLLTIRLPESMIDEATIAGEKFLFVQGCFEYKTINMPQRSYFCYYYQPGFTKISNLSYCN